MPPLTAETLKNTLWETLQDIKAEKMLPGRGDAIAAQAREILRTVKVQMQILAMTKRAVPRDIVEFSGQHAIEVSSPKSKPLKVARRATRGRP